MLKISVVIPTFRRTGLLRDCLSSLLRQSFNKDDFEVLVVSDGPDEMTARLANEFAEQNKLFLFLETPFKKGPAAARNFGWRQAKGILIAFTDDDTLPNEHWLSDLWSAYNGEKEIAFTGKIKVPLPKPPTDYAKNTAGLEQAEFVTANCCCTKEALRKVGGFDEEFAMAWREDSDLHFKLLQHGVPIVHLENALVIHPVRPAPWGISIKEQKKGMFNALLYKKYPGLYRKKIQPSPAWNYYLMIACVIVFVIALIAGKKWLQFVSLFIWMALSLSFISRRLKGTATTPRHLMEMIVTSLCIPFISVYWQLYGAWRYKVLFL